MVVVAIERFRIRRVVASLAMACAVALGPASAAEPETPPPASDATADSAQPGADAAAAEEEEEVTSLEDTIRVLQQRPIIKALRFELALTAGVAAADTMYSHQLVGATGRFHISEWFSVGATYAKYFSSESDLFDEVIGDFELFPERAQIRWYAGGDISVVPIDGKLVLFDDAIIYWDIFASLGGGVTVTSRSDSPKPTGMIGVGMRLFFNEWLTLTFELRDHIYVEDFAAGTELTNNIVGQAGVSIFIPFGFDYSYPR